MALNRYDLDMVLETKCRGVVYAGDAGEAPKAFDAWRAQLVPGLNQVVLKGIIRTNPEALDGETVIAVVEDGEVTLL